MKNLLNVLTMTLILSTTANAFNSSGEIDGTTAVLKILKDKKVKSKIRSQKIQKIELMDVEAFGNGKVLYTYFLETSACQGQVALFKKQFNNSKGSRIVVDSSELQCGVHIYDSSDNNDRDATGLPKKPVKCLALGCGKLRNPSTF